MGRATQGVRVIRLDEDDQIADVAVISESETPEIVPTKDESADSNERPSSESSSNNEEANNEEE